MIQHVYEKAVASGASQVYVATDHQTVFDAVKKFTDNVLMTREDHQSGTERLAEVVEQLKLESDTIVVNVQGDEPLLASENVSQVAMLLADSDAPMATLSTSIDEIDDIFNPNCVKVINDADNNALYFSRSPIPYHRDAMMNDDRDKLNLADFARHIGIYAYRAGFINTYVNWAPSALEQIECLEQLRVLWYGEKIHVAVAKEAPAAGVDTQEDLDAVRAIVANEAK